MRNPKRKTIPLFLLTNHGTVRGQSMVLVLDGQPGTYEHLPCRVVMLFTFEVPVDINICLEEIKSKSAYESDLPPTRRTLGQTETNTR